MTLKAVPFKRWHYQWLREQGASAEGGGFPLADSVLEQLEEHNTWTYVDDAGPFACAGTVAQWRGRHLAWAYLSPAARRHAHWLTKAARAGLTLADGRIEMTVRADFEPGHRWARLLGFEVETPVMRAFGPLGEDHVGYVRFN